MEKQKPALARITVMWYVIGFFLTYFILQPHSILGYVGLIFIGFIASNILPMIASAVLNLFGIPSWTITNIGRQKEQNIY